MAPAARVASNEGTRRTRATSQPGVPKNSTSLVQWKPTPLSSSRDQPLVSSRDQPLDASPVHPPPVPESRDDIRARIRVHPDRVRVVLAPIVLVRRRARRRASVFRLGAKRSVRPGGGVSARGDARAIRERRRRSPREHVSIRAAREHLSRVVSNRHRARRREVSSEGGEGRRSDAARVGVRARAFRAAHANHHATARATSDAIRARDGVVLVRVARVVILPVFSPPPPSSRLPLSSPPPSSRLPLPSPPLPLPFPFPRANAAGTSNTKTSPSLDGWYTRRPSAVTASVVAFFASLGATREQSVGVFPVGEVP